MENGKATWVWYVYKQWSVIIWGMEKWKKNLMD